MYNELDIIHKLMILGREWSSCERNGKDFMEFFDDLELLVAFVKDNNQVGFERHFQLFCECNKLDELHNYYTRSKDLG